MDNNHKGKIEEVIYHGDHTRVRLSLLGKRCRQLVDDKCPKTVLQQFKLTYRLVIARVIGQVFLIQNIRHLLSYCER